MNDLESFEADKLSSVSLLGLIVANLSHRPSLVSNCTVVYTCLFKSHDQQFLNN